MANEREQWLKEGFSQITAGLDTDRNWDRATPIRGMFLDVRTVNVKRTDPETGEIKEVPTQLYLIESNGDIVGVWGSTGLDTLMNRVELGTEVGIICLGKQPQKNDPSRTVWVYEVFSKSLGNMPTVEPTTENELDKELGIN